MILLFTLTVITIWINGSTGRLTTTLSSPHKAAMPMHPRLSKAPVKQFWWSCLPQSTPFSFYEVHHRTTTSARAVRWHLTSPNTLLNHWDLAREVAYASNDCEWRQQKIRSRALTILSPVWRCLSTHHTPLAVRYASKTTLAKSRLPEGALLQETDMETDEDGQQWNTQAVTSQLEVGTVQDEPIQCPYDEAVALATWKEQLKHIKRSAAVALIPKLVTSNPLMFDAKGTSLVSYAINEKSKHPDKVLLLRVGEFYETYGIDAVMLVEYAGLNPMGGKPRAGCPKMAIQATLDALTSNGLSCCVYEELSNLNTVRRTSSRGIKQRVMAQIVSPESPTYMQENMCFTDGDTPYSVSRPIFSLFHSTTDGYSLAEIHIDERRVYTHDFLTVEGVRLKLESGKAFSAYIHRSRRDHTAELVKLHAPAMQKNFLRGYGTSQEFHLSVLQIIAKNLDISPSEFSVLESSTASARPHPLYLSTATQLGLISSRYEESSFTRQRKSLHESVLLEDASPAAINFIRGLLLNPPPRDVSRYIQQLNAALSKNTVPLPESRPIPIGKIVSLLTYRTANRNFFNDLAGIVKSMLYCLEHFSIETMEPLLKILEYETQQEITLKRLWKTFGALKLIEDTVATTTPDAITSGSNLESLNELFYRLEEFRGRVDTCKIQAEYTDVLKAAYNLYFCILEDFGCVTLPAAEKSPSHYSLERLSNYLSELKLSQLNAVLTMDAVNQGVFLKRPPKYFTDKDTAKLEHPKDRHGRVLPKYWTTHRVAALTKLYAQQCEKASRRVVEILQDLSFSLQPYLPNFIECTSFHVILQSFNSHVALACSKGWTLPTLSDELALKVNRLLPYNLDNEAVAATFNLSGLLLLTGHNMAGKSVLCRSALALALLANSGLYCPCGPSTTVPRYDAFISACAIAHDVPEHNRSLYGQELEQIRVLLKDGTHRSFVTIDEPCKGTSPKCGAALVGALLEELDNRRISGFVSTHLHEELSRLPLSIPRTSFKRMGSIISNGEIKWTYQLEDGMCSDSLGILTAQHIGLPPDLIERAAALEVLIQHHHKDITERLSRTPQRLEDSNADTIEERTTLPNDCAVGGLAEATFNGEQQMLPMFSNMDIQQIYNLVQLVCECSSEDLLFLQHNTTVPALWVGTSCVYLLISQRPHDTAFNSSFLGFRNIKYNHILRKSALRKIDTAVYVGETDAILDRLRHHRGKKQWKEASVLVVSAKNKSAARYYESKLIRMLKKRGFHVLSQHDGMHRQFGLNLQSYSSMFDIRKKKRLKGRKRLQQEGYG